MPTGVPVFRDTLLLKVVQQREALHPPGYAIKKPTEKCVLEV
jgi:hypothetical protein